MSSHLKVVTPPKRSSFPAAMRRSLHSWTRWRQRRLERKQRLLLEAMDPLLTRLQVRQLEQEEWQEKVETLLELLVRKHQEATAESRELLLELLQSQQPSPEEQIVQLLGQPTLLPSSPSSAS